MKSTITSIIEQFLPQLSKNERLEALRELQRIVDHERFELAKETDATLVCKKCGSIHVVKRGKTSKGTQRYLCADCGTSFTLDNTSVFSTSKLPKETWMKYIECFIDLLPLRECAMRCNVSLKTAFFMRHRLLETLYDYMPAFQVREGCGAIIDETFFRESFKGNHTKGTFKLPRKARKRGGSLHTPGISKEQVCVLTGINDTGDMFYNIACRGHLKSNTALSLLEGRIQAGAIVTTDKHNAYPRALRELGVATHNAFDALFERGKLSPINALHSNIKAFMVHFRGVATRHLGNYLAWFKWLSCFKKNKNVQETSSLIVRQVSIGGYTTTWRKYKNLPFLFMDYWEQKTS